MNQITQNLSSLIQWPSERFGFDETWTRRALLASVSLPVMVGIVRHVTAFQRRRSLFKQRAEYRDRLKSQMEHVEKHCQSKISEDRAVEITSLSFEDLQSKLQRGELSCVDVLYAYQRVAFRENKQLNFIVQPVMEAEEIARRLDGLNLEARNNLPLFGIPISVKENFQMAGYASTAGLSNLIGRNRVVSSGILEAVLDAGAVPFIRTNLAQTMMSLGGHNPIYGQTRNPLDIRRSPGGSSAGEGAAIGSGASMIGLGSDIGGSVRVPGAWCGIYALKPTAGRFSVANQTSAIQGQTAVKGTSGFMTKDVKALVEFTRAVSSDFQFDVDTYLPRIYFNEEEYSSTKPLTIAYSYHWPPIAATESSKNAVSKAVAELSSQGHKVVEWNLPKFEDILPLILVQSYFGDAGAQMAQSLEDDDVSYIIQTMIRAFRAPIWLKRRIASVASWLIPSNWVYKYLIGLTGIEDVDKWFQLQQKVNRYRQLWLEDWKRQGIDILLVPAVPTPAEYIDEKIGCSSGAGAYAYLLNLVNFPAGVVPFGKISAEDEVNDLQCYPDTDLMQRRLKEQIKGSAGLPLSVQCVALPYREEMCLRVMTLLSKMDQ